MQTGERGRWHHILHRTAGDRDHDLACGRCLSSEVVHHRQGWIAAAEHREVVSRDDHMLQLRRRFIRRPAHGEGRAFTWGECAQGWSPQPEPALLRVALVFGDIHAPRQPVMRHLINLQAHRTQRRGAEIGQAEGLVTRLPQHRLAKVIRWTQRRELRATDLLDAHRQALEARLRGEVQIKARHLARSGPRMKIGL